jgi:hypothetical protein
MVSTLSAKDHLPRATHELERKLVAVLEALDDAVAEHFVGGIGIRLAQTGTQLPQCIC